MLFLFLGLLWPWRTVALGTESPLLTSAVCTMIIGPSAIIHGRHTLATPPARVLLIGTCDVIDASGRVPIGRTRASHRTFQA